MLVRAENPGDVSSISAVVSEAFRRLDRADEPVPETWLVEALRGSDAWIPQLSLVAVDDDGVVGYCLSTRARVAKIPVLALGPIGVSSRAQGRGVGTALLNTTIDTAREMGEPLIGLLGDYRYYERFGFVPASGIGIEAPDGAWGRHFQVLTLPAYHTSIRGRFEYAEPFRRLS
jgi:putative acetyltransferase